uniref:translation initiation factor IF-2-like n=1 Tax=Ictidomys tridecemlineatus TaxID=43179 RepID=UPI000B53D97F|nr:translation initiation factor IF-2-like [Ictidomys tridecemlineatus]XP_021581531.1 translation initiation factor IF-2-like [Ictidomys tridecemlineatus]XP_021581532.1 translation initiation factor IF-2-like [Ictidomys tridecemlineatus]XP_040126949.1 translation initiation factor IF-2-like [Ictidomys tridecemlineatus]
MRNSCLPQSPPAAASARALLWQAGVWAKLVAHFRPLGSPLALSPAAVQLWLQRAPVDQFPDTGHQHGVSLQPLSGGSGGGVRRNHPPRCPSSLRGGRWALPAGTQEGPRPGGSGARSPRLTPRAPLERCGLLRGEARERRGSAGRARGHRGVTGLPRGLCSALLPHCALPSSPLPKPPRLGPVCFSSPAPSTRHANSPRGCVSGWRPWPRAGRSPAGASAASSGPSGNTTKGEGALGPSGSERGKRQPGRGGGRMGAWPPPGAKAQLLGSEGLGRSALGPSRRGPGGLYEGPHQAWALNAMPATRINPVTPVWAC